MASLRCYRRLLLSSAAIAATLGVAAAPSSAMLAAAAPASSGGAGFGGPAPTQTSVRVPAPPSRSSRGRWLTNFVVTEYWPAPEAWFVGKAVSAPGLTSKHRIDWLYSAMGVSMEGEGIGIDGRIYHINALGRGGWVTVNGAPTAASDGWSAGSPFWRAGGFWRNRSGGVTFPLAAGGWASGVGRGYVPLPGVSFAQGASLPLNFLQSIAVDPSVIPLGSRVYIPAYRHDGHGGWFVAQDTGGAIAGHHVDVYRKPPASPSQSGQYMTRQRVYVIKPHSR